MGHILNADSRALSWDSFGQLGWDLGWAFSQAAHVILLKDQEREGSPSVCALLGRNEKSQIISQWWGTASGRGLVFVRNHKSIILNAVLLWSRCSAPRGHSPGPTLSPLIPKNESVEGKRKPGGGKG